MNFERFTKCSEGHTNQLEFCCLRERKVFCQKCWNKDHYLSCYSTRCGHYEKFAHLVIGKVLQMKTVYYASEMSSNYEKFKNFKNQILNCQRFFVDRLKTQIQIKAPLFMNQMISNMLESKEKNMDNISYESDCCRKMLQIINQKSGIKTYNLSLAVTNYEKIVEDSKAFDDKLKTKQFQGKSDVNLSNCIGAYSQYLTKMLTNLKRSYKKNLQSEIKDSLEHFDPKINFEGIKFKVKPTFTSFEKYEDKSTLLEIFKEFQQNRLRLYNGFTLDKQKLEQSSEAVLQISKSFLKQKLFEMHQKIKDFKSSYPFKYGYIISTTVQPDESYELQIIKMEKKVIKTLQKNAQRPFYNSINIIIMGPQCIINEYRRVNNSIESSIKIYGFTPERKQTIEKIINMFELDQGKIQKKRTQIPYEKPPSSLSRAYINFELAYQHLFLDDQNGFEGEKYIEARGTKRFETIAQNWVNKTDDQIEIEIEKNEEELKMLLI